MTIHISAGHYPAKPGATYEGLSEHDEAVFWVEEIYTAMADSIGSGVSVCKVPTGFLKEKTEFINSHDPELALEVHFNSFKLWEDYNKDGIVDDDELKAAGDGCETLYYPGSEKGKRFAEFIQEAMAQVFSPNRGVHEGWFRRDPKRGPNFFLARTRCPSIIIEPEFIDNREVIQTNRGIACDLIASSLVTAYEDLRK